MASRDSPLLGHHPKNIDPLHSILQAREDRSILKSRISANGFCSLSLTLNIPGYPKSNPLIHDFFRNCLKDFKYFLNANLIAIFEEGAMQGCDEAGDYYIVPCNPGNMHLSTIKQYCEDFEKNHPLGRFIDADLNDWEGNTISSGKLKICFFCLERPAIDCRREKAHEYEELRAFMFPQMEAYSRQQREGEIVRRLTAYALKAILTEIALTPKPGLVDKFSNGSHQDMNFRMFLDSTSSIMPWFSRLVIEGFGFEEEDLTLALPVIRNIGLRMESAMNESTGNINTQKGVIFLMSLSLFAAGRCFGRNGKFDCEDFREIIRCISKDIVKRELVDSTPAVKSNGSKVHHKYCFGGARAEAESGFKTVFDFGLPQLTGIRDIDDVVLTKCFLAIAANNYDTNILHRSSPEFLTKFQELCSMALKDFSDRNYDAVLDFCKVNNISPGGSADLLAVTIFVWSVIHANQENK